MPVSVGHWSLFSPLQFDRRVFDTAPRTIACAPFVQVIFDGDTTWTSLMPDVVSEVGISATRGITGTSPTDRVCQPGTLEFTLRNDAANSGGTASWYSPTHPRRRAGWIEGIPVRLVAVYDGTLYVLWTGRIRTIDPTPGKTPMRVAVFAQDAAADLAIAYAPNIPPQIGQSEVDLLNAVMAALTDDVRPPTAFDAPLDTYQFAFDQTGDNAIALSLITDAVLSAVGTAFIDASGRLVYRNRQVEAATEPALTIGNDDLLYRGPGFSGASSLKNVFNRIHVTVHPKTTDPNEVLFSSTGAVELVPGTPVEVWDNYSDPNNRDRLVGGYNFTPVTKNTDYQAADNADGSGSNRTNDVAITVTPFVASAKTTLTNTSATELFVTMRQLRGTAIFDNAPSTLESFVAKPYGDRLATVDLPFQDSVLKAQNIADFFLAQYADRSRAGEELVYWPSRSHALMVGALSLDIGAVVIASEETSGVANVPYEIRAITYLFERAWTGAVFTVRYKIVPHATGAPDSAAWTFDHPTYGLFDSGLVFGFA